MGSSISKLWTINISQEQNQIGTLGVRFQRNINNKTSTDKICNATTMFLDENQRKVVKTV